jgi:hypothetical protein
MCPSEGGFRVVRTWVVPAEAIARVRASPGGLAAVAGDFDRAPEAVDDWMIAVWLSAREEGLHDTTTAGPLALLAAAVH